MAKIYSEALKKSIEIDRLIGHLESNQSGPTVIFTAGIHGNEPAGVFALKEVIDELQKNNPPLKGNIYAVSGNLWALEKGERYHKKDLNRVWTKENFALLEKGELPIDCEDSQQQLEIYDTIMDILHHNIGPFYFIDLHTTSSQTVPFLTVNDSLLNRKYVSQYPAPVILGIEEYLDGPLLSAINELGYVAFGFEGGQHDSLSAIENHAAFVRLSLVFSGIMEAANINFQEAYSTLAGASIGLQNIFEIIYRYEVKDNSKFKMKPGYVNFQEVQQAEVVAHYGDQTVIAKESCRILMPLYQNKGNDGFFLIEKISRRVLKWSASLRKLKIDHLLPLLSGIKWTSKKKESMMVDLRVARFFAKSFFHLLGFRNKTIDESHMIIKNREKASRTKDYRGAPWF